MRHIFKLALVLLFFCNAALQAEFGFKYVPGYVIQLNGDTLKGQLLSQVSKDAGEKCIFKIETGEEKIFTPGEIQGYKHEGGKYYISKEIPKDSLNKQTVFLEYLIKGITSMYYLYDGTDAHYYAEKDGIGMFELTESQKITTINSSNFIAPTQTKGKLLYIMQDCPDMKYDIMHVTLDHKSLIKLAKNYHENVCGSESCIIYEKDNLEAKATWSVFAGFSINHYIVGRFAYNLAANYQIGGGLKLSNILRFDDQLNIRIKLIMEKDANNSKLVPYDFPYSIDVESDGVGYFLKKDNSYHESIYLTSLKVNSKIIDVNIPVTINKDIPISTKTTFFFGAGPAMKYILYQNSGLKVMGNQVVNPFLLGLYANLGLEGKWYGNHTFTLNVSYGHFFDNKQFSIQLGMAL